MGGLKNLSLSSWTRDNNGPTPDSILDQFVTSMKHLKSLFLSLEFPLTDRYELLCRLGTKCKSIKHLEFHCWGIVPVDKQFFSAIHFFEKIESLTLDLYWYEFDNQSKIWAFILELLQKCQSLKKLIINTSNEHACVEAFSTARFFSHFIHCIQKRNVNIEVKHRLYFGSIIKDIGIITRNKVIWRNKLVHWMGYGLSQNSSNVQFMDLAIESTAPNAKQPRNPFNLILTYLDLNSLQSMSNTNRKCSQLC